MFPANEITLQLLKLLYAAKRMRNTLKITNAQTSAFAHKAQTNSSLMACVLEAVSRRPTYFYLPKQKHTGHFSPPPHPHPQLLVQTPRPPRSHPPETPRGELLAVTSSLMYRSQMCRVQSAFTVAVPIRFFSAHLHRASSHITRTSKSTDALDVKAERRGLDKEAQTTFISATHST